MRALLFGLLAVGSLAGGAQAQVFGLTAGQSLEQIPSATPTGGIEPGEYTITPPEPDAEFSSYKALVYPATGLCAVSAYAAPSGKTGIKAAMEAIARQKALAAKLDQVYGPTMDEEFGDNDGTIESDLAEGTVVVIRAYSKEDNRLPKGIDRVALFLQSEEGVPQVFVSFEFPDQNICLNARNAEIDATPPPQ